MSTVEKMYEAVQPVMQASRAEDAIRALRNILSAFPDFAYAHNDLAVLSYQMGDKGRALRHYEAAAHLEPRNITFQKNLADFYYIEQNRIKDALQLYVKVLEIEPADIETLLALGKICSEMQQHDDAIVFFKRVLEIEPWNQVARASLERLESKEPVVAQGASAQAVHSEAVRLASSGDSGGALKLLERLTETHPDFALGHNDLGVLAYQAGHTEKALVHYEYAARLEPQDSKFRKNLADCYWVGFGRSEDALKVYVDILKTHPEDIETLMAIGKLCQSLRQTDDARVFFERVLEIEPWNSDARTQLEQAEAAVKAA
jgi:tetratricopeptide (TPR) repeat protein